jgi:hypothetical protein
VILDGVGDLSMSLKMTVRGFGMGYSRIDAPVQTDSLAGWLIS